MHSKLRRNGRLPLHLGMECKAPVGALLAVLKANPDAVKRADKDQRLPLHLGLLHAGDTFTVPNPTPHGTVEKITATLKRGDAETSYGFGLGTTDDGHAYITEVKDDGMATL